MRLVVGKVIPWGSPSSINFMDMGNAGAAIINSNDTSALGDPVARIGEIEFSSWHYDYISCRLRASTTLSLPARPTTYRSSGGKSGSSYVVATGGAAEYLVGSYNLGYIPMVIGYCPTTGRALGSSTVYANGDSLRILTLVATSTSVSMSESYYVGYSGLPALTVNVIALIMDQGLQQASANNYPYQFAALGDRVIIGNGKIDTDRNYIFRDNAGYRLSVAPSIELAVTTNVTNIGYGGFTTGATRLRTFSDWLQQSWSTNAYGSWSTAIGGEWPYMSCNGQTIGIGL